MINAPPMMSKLIPVRIIRPMDTPPELQPMAFSQMEGRIHTLVENADDVDSRV
ncbi:hypothetical protein [Corynebacterium nuruki]|uniref:hypothetical protein n=1 Tax=Corynebacterium nuruki TaxID=1032851 RepID=UPI0039BFA892